MNLFRRKKKNKGDFVRRRRYRLAIENLSSRSTLWETKGSRAGMAWAIFGAFVASGVIWLLIFEFTPLSQVLPGHMTQDMRSDYQEMSLRLDSVIECQRITDQYANNILQVLELTQTDSVSEPKAEPQQTPVVLPVDSLIEASAAERSFVTRFEQAERYSLSVLSPIAADGMAFFNPVTGVKIEEKISDGGIPSIQIIPGRTTPVSAIYRGTVLNSYFTTGRGFTVVIQHPNDFISIYSGLADTFLARGDKVLAGTRIGIAEQKRYPLTIELWHNGVPLPPMDYLTLDPQP